MFLQLNGCWNACFFRLVRENCEAKGNSGEETRRQYKTLIRNLFKEAKADFPALSCPEFPAIKKSVRQKRHFTHQEWEQLGRVAAELSGGAARRSLTVEDYPALGTTQYIRDFADNGHTSPKLLEVPYLRFIQREKTAAKARAAITPGKCSMVRCVENNL